VSYDDKIQHWQYMVNHFRAEAERCTPTPEGDALRGIYLSSAESAQNQLDRVKKEAMTGSHTPGPWTYLGYSKSLGWVVELPGSAGINTRRIRCEGWSDAEAVANSHLVAAAPDLLEAIVMFLRNEDSTRNEYRPLYTWEDIEGKMRVAVEKARGEL
jgi:hypothetical protein